MFLRTGQGPKIRAEARNPGPGATTLPTTHAGTESGHAMRPNKGRFPHIAKGPA